jgi:hypothetical protein
MFELGMNFKATGGPVDDSASHTSANPPRPRKRRNRYPGDGSAPTPMAKAPGVVERMFGGAVTTKSPLWRAVVKRTAVDDQQIVNFLTATLAHEWLQKRTHELVYRKFACADRRTIGYQLWANVKLQPCGLPLRYGITP